MRCEDVFHFSRRDNPLQNRPVIKDHIGNKFKILTLIDLIFLGFDLAAKSVALEHLLDLVGIQTTFCGYLQQNIVVRQPEVFDEIGVKQRKIQLDRSGL